MKTFFYSLWYDLKRNKTFNILIFVAILVLLAILTVLLGVGEKTK